MELSVINHKRLLLQMISLMLATLLLIACGDGEGTHPAVSVVKQYIELGKDLEKDGDGDIDIGPILNKALDLWDGGLPLGNEILTPLLPQYYETITYEIVEDNGDKIQARVTFSDPNDAEMQPELTLDYLVIQQGGEWLITRRVQ